MHAEFSFFAIFFSCFNFLLLFLLLLLLIFGKINGSKIQQTFKHNEHDLQNIQNTHIPEK